MAATDQVPFRLRVGSVPADAGWSGLASASAAQRVLRIAWAGMRKTPSMSDGRVFIGCIVTERRVSEYDKNYRLRGFVGHAHPNRGDGSGRDRHDGSEGIGARRR